MNAYFLLLSLLFYAHKILPFFKQNSKFHHHGVKKNVLRSPASSSTSGVRVLPDGITGKHMDLIIATQLGTFLDLGPVLQCVGLDCRQIISSSMENMWHV